MTNKYYPISPEEETDIAKQYEQNSCPDTTSGIIFMIMTSALELIGYRWTDNRRQWITNGQVVVNLNVDYYGQLFMNNVSGHYIVPLDPIDIDPDDHILKLSMELKELIETLEKEPYYPDHGRYVCYR